MIGRTWGDWSSLFMWLTQLDTFYLIGIFLSIKHLHCICYVHLCGVVQQVVSSNIQCCEEKN